MTRKRSASATAGLAACLLVLALAGCVAAGASSTTSTPGDSPGQAGMSGPAYTPVGSPVQGSLPPDSGATPTATSVGGAAGSGTVTVTMADNEKTVQMVVGQNLSLSLGGGVLWSLAISDAKVLQRLPAPVPTGVDGIYKAIAVGSANLNGTGRPDCSGGGFCPQFVLAFSINIVVG
ncbi:MAG TPA: hypothetical protein VF337_08850 [Candidatus Limnocylindrales bacterium]